MNLSVRIIWFLPTQAISWRVHPPLPFLSHTFVGSSWWHRSSAGECITLPQQKWPNQQIAMLLEISSLRSLLNKKIWFPHIRKQKTHHVSRKVFGFSLFKQVHDRPSALIEIKMSVGDLTKDDNLEGSAGGSVGCWFLETKFADYKRQFPERS